MPIAQQPSPLFRGTGEASFAGPILLVARVLVKPFARSAIKEAAKTEAKAAVSAVGRAAPPAQTLPGTGANAAKTTSTVVETYSQSATLPGRSQTGYRAGMDYLNKTTAARQALTTSKTTWAEHVVASRKAMEEAFRIMGIQ